LKLMCPKDHLDWYWKSPNIWEKTLSGEFCEVKPGKRTSAL
jgi:hypothetical protein